MTTTSDKRRTCVAAALLVLLGSACADKLMVPQFGSVNVWVRISGGEPNDDRYDLTVDSVVRPLLAESGHALISGITPGSHTLSLKPAAENCTVSGTPSLPVAVPALETIDVSFALTCVTTGVGVTTRTTGPDSPFYYEVVVDHLSAWPIAANSSLVLSRLKPGIYTLGLSFPGDNCTVAGGKEITVSVSNRAVTPVLFDVACKAVPPIAAPPAFPALLRPGQIYRAPDNLYDAYLSIHQSSLASRYVLYDSSTFALQFASVRFPFFEYRGHYSRTDAGLMITFDDDSRWTATGIMRGDSLFIKYSLIASMSDFVDGVYVRSPGQ